MEGKKRGRGEKGNFKKGRKRKEDKEKKGKEEGISKSGGRRKGEKKKGGKKKKGKREKKEGKKGGEKMLTLEFPLGVLVPKPLGPLKSHFCIENLNSFFQKQGHYILNWVQLMLMPCFNEICTFFFGQGGDTSIETDRQTDISLYV